MSSVTSGNNIKKIFGSLSMIKSLNKNFLDRLEEYESNKKENLGSIFTKFVPFLKTYTQYYDSYETATNFFREMKKEKKFGAWYAKQETKIIKEKKGLSLLSYLIAPIQRVLNLH
jgi:hypothetical protein